MRTDDRAGELEHLTKELQRQQASVLIREADQRVATSDPQTPTIPIELRTAIKQFATSPQNVWVCNHDYSARLAEDVAFDPVKAFRGVHGTGDLTTLTTRGTFGKATLVVDVNTQQNQLQIIELEYFPLLVIAEANSTGPAVSGIVRQEFRQPNQGVSLLNQTIDLVDQQDFIGDFESGQKYYCTLIENVSTPQAYQGIKKQGGGPGQIALLPQGSTIPRRAGTVAGTANLKRVTIDSAGNLTAGTVDQKVFNLSDLTIHATLRDMYIPVDDRGGQDVVSLPDVAMLEDFLTASEMHIGICAGAEPKFISGGTVTSLRVNGTTRVFEYFACGNWTNFHTGNECT